MREDTSVGAPIIVKRVVRAHRGHHGGAWKVAYADMVTALMALFIVLWILAQSEHVKQSVAGYFRNPIGFEDGGAPAPDKTGLSSGEVSLMENTNPAPPTSPMKTREDPNEAFREQAQMIRSAFRDISGLEAHLDQIEFALTPEGLQITLLETVENPLFAVGGTKLSDAATAMLRTIAGQISASENFITISGHTDSRPGENWDLSTGRAHEARAILEGAEIDAERIYEVRGFANRQLYNPMDPFDSRNRRIAITLLSFEAYLARQRSLENTALVGEVY